MDSDDESLGLLTASTKHLYRSIIMFSPPSRWKYLLYDHQIPFFCRWFSSPKSTPFTTLCLEGLIKLISN